MSSNKKFDEELKRITNFRIAGKNCFICINAEPVTDPQDIDAGLELHCKRLDIYVARGSVCDTWGMP